MQPSCASILTADDGERTAGHSAVLCGVGAALTCVETVRSIVWGAGVGGDLATVQGSTPAAAACCLRLLRLSLTALPLQQPAATR